ncbi:MAG TPA: hypothetical protein VNY24_14450 [Candidatus Acidoferrales bacterium]|jgi:hypothetical protein|nr:hypothetical protein [Candidatus Acidoferrales bacterium]
MSGEKIGAGLKGQRYILEFGEIVQAQKTAAGRDAESHHGPLLGVAG